MKLAARCYFSFRSPYAWLAMRTLDQQGLGIGSSLVYQPYFEPPAAMLERLHQRGGRMLYTPMSRERHLYILSDVKRSVTAAGLTPRWPQDHNPDWSIPHLVYLACPNDQVRRAFAMASFEARWLRGEDIWQWSAAEAALRSCLAEVQVAAVLSHARSAAIDNAALDVLYSAYMDDVFGVPFLIVGREKFWGNDRIEQFVAAHDAALEREKKREHSY